MPLPARGGLFASVTRESIPPHNVGYVIARLVEAERRGKWSAARRSGRGTTCSAPEEHWNEQREHHEHQRPGADVIPPRITLLRRLSVALPAVLRQSLAHLTLFCCRAGDRAEQLLCAPSPNPAVPRIIKHRLCRGMSARRTGNGGYSVDADQFAVNLPAADTGKEIGLSRAPQKCRIPASQPVSAASRGDALSVQRLGDLPKALARRPSTADQRHDAGAEGAGGEGRGRLLRHHRRRLPRGFALFAGLFNPNLGLEWPLRERADGSPRVRTRHWNLYVISTSHVKV